jgi:hypothetical protein
MAAAAVGSSDSVAFAVATYPDAGTANDGKVVAAGFTINPKRGPVGHENVAVVRYDLNGALDPSFGGTGG